jgi:hypothetical protein
MMKPMIVHEYVPRQDEIADDLVECIRKQRHPVSGALPQLNSLLFRYALECELNLQLMFELLSGSTTSHTALIVHHSLRICAIC